MGADKELLAQNRACFVVVYFGVFPVWFSAFLISCGFNPHIDWIIYTDIEPPQSTPDNVKFRKLTFDEFKRKASLAVGVELQFTNPYKLCDFKPMYGDVFQNELTDYEYWGHCDIDLVWGDLETFLTGIHFTDYDIISSREKTICGHLTLYRNKESVNRLYKEVKRFEKIFEKDGYAGFDEGFFSFHLYQESLKEGFPFNIYWPKKDCVDWPELNIRPYGWYWNNGKVYEATGIERLYLHFMTWKKSMTSIDFKFEDHPNTFKIARNGIWSGLVPLSSKLVYWYPEHLGRVAEHYWTRVVNKLLRRNGFRLNIPDDYRVIE